MKSRNLKTVVTTLVASMVISSAPNVSFAKTFGTSIDAANALTEDARSLIKSINPEPAFVIDPAILSDSNENAKVIVELKGGSVADVIKGTSNSKSADNEKKKKEQKDKISKDHKEFKEKANKIFKDNKVENVKFSKEYSYTFNGIAVELPKDEVKTLLQTGMVKRIWKDEIVQAPQPIELEETKTSEGVSLPSALPHMGVDKLHDEGITGKGIKVAVIDTGIDYNHPDLKDAYKGGYDFVDNDNDPMETTYQDWLDAETFEQLYGSTYYTSHGTHVSGTIAANPKNEVAYAMTGVAPNVDLYAYRVLGPYGRGETSNILSGIEYAVEQNMDVINLSLGSFYNTSLETLAVAINNVAKFGVVPCVAAGNAGEGIGTMSTPGTSPFAITVGASSLPTDYPTTTLKLDDAEFITNLLASNFGDDEKDIAEKEYELVNVGTGFPNEVSGKDLKGKVAIVKRSFISLDSIIGNLKYAGAKAAIIYNDVDSPIPYFFGEDANYIPTFTLTKSQGEVLLSKIGTNKPLYIGKLTANTAPGDYIASFSSRGPVLNNYDIKPDVVAPGVNIISTYPGFMNSRYEEKADYTKAYYASSGTSMATPHVAGVAALILQSHPDYGVEDVKAALANTADPLAKEYNIFEIGAGRVDAYEAVHSDNLVQVIDTVETLRDNGKVIEVENIAPSLRFGQIYESEKDEALTLEMKVSNLSDKPETFNVSVEFLNLLNSSGVVSNAEENGVTLDIADKVTVDANQVGSLNATINIPATAAKGIYQGNVYFTNSSDSKEVFQVPFAVRHSEKGFDYVKVNRYAASNDFDNSHPNLRSTVSGTFKINSPMKTMDIVLTKPTGEALGFIAKLDMTNTAFDLQYLMNNFFDGNYSPILDKGQIGKPTLVPEGEYKISFVAKDANEDVYEISYPLFIDNTKPDIEFAEGSNLNFYEISEDDLTVEKDSNGKEYKAFWFHGNIYDETSKHLGELGYSIDQSKNTISLQKNYNYTKDIIKPDKDGNFKFPIAIDELKNEPLSLKLSYYDYATAGNVIPREIFIAKADQGYTTVDYDKDSVKLNDTLTATVNVNNTQDFANGSFKFDIDSKCFEYDVKLSDEFIAEVEKVGGTATLKEEGTYWTTYKVTVEGNTEPLNGDFPVLEVNAKVISDKYWSGKISFAEDNAFSYENSKASKINLKAYSKGFDLVSKTSMLMVDVSRGEALTRDYTQAGVKVWLEDKSGKQYNATRINYIGIAQIENIPAEQEYTLYIDIPGHFLYSTPINVYDETANGEKVGAYKMWFPDTIAAGDVNRDGKINKIDEKQVLKAYGEGGFSVVEDLNKDGIVNEYDLYYVLKNVNLKNPYSIK